MNQAGDDEFLTAKQIRERRRQDLLRKFDAPSQPQKPVPAPAATVPTLLDDSRRLRKQDGEIQPEPREVLPERPVGSSSSGSWSLPLRLQNLSPSAAAAFRKRMHLTVRGASRPPPVPSFQEMRFPKQLIQSLSRDGICHPTPLQMQAIPAMLLGRDVVGVAAAGTGKTLCHVLPALLLSMDAECHLPLTTGEGPLCVILLPSKETAKAVYELLERCAARLDFPSRRFELLAASETRENPTTRPGTHICVGTPGLLVDALQRGRMHMLQCDRMILDDADHLLDGSYESELTFIAERLKGPKQLCLFSTTALDTVPEVLAATSPIFVQQRLAHLRLSAAQDIEYVKEAHKLLFMSRCLKKTSSPVVVVVDSSQVEGVIDYLAGNNVRTVDLSEAQRPTANRVGRAEVIVVTDDTLEQLDLPPVHHIIQFDAPCDIGTYTQRVQFAGKCCLVSTLFINKTTDITFMRDLLCYLTDTRLPVPPWVAIAAAM
ncbi:MAG: hypothetical protein KVP17_002113 [Porospora cf. gigantea B]|uniref:uncharacterized protein n=1 Tax=Porospora cf. gigantea B TaxID=2853592 RepID=UPI003571CAFF|nr:MAG: hypothetical protein KVP17_002113 [Porospora cf. gigantea B]